MRYLSGRGLIIENKRESKLLIRSKCWREGLDDRCKYLGYYFRRDLELESFIRFSVNFRTVSTFPAVSCGF